MYTKASPDYKNVNSEYYKNFLQLFYLKESAATHSSILAWENPWTEKPGGLQSWGLKESETTE